MELLKGNYPDLFSKRMPQKADVVIGGFPCQDFSLAGKRRGFNSKEETYTKVWLRLLED